MGQRSGKVACDSVRIMPLVDKSRFRPTPVLRPRRRKLLARVRLLHADGTPCDVVVENVSSTGLQAIAARGAPELGAGVTIEMPDGPAIWGVVRWTDGLRFGVEVNPHAEPETSATPETKHPLLR